MRLKSQLYSSLIITVIIFTLSACGGHDTQNAAGITLHLRTKTDSVGDTTRSVVTEKKEQWEPSRTAIIVTDMWDQHWCKGATSRVAELAPFMNKVIDSARKKGVLIVYAPSDCMDYYKDYPGRKAALKFADTLKDEPDGGVKFAAEKNKPWPIDQSNEGCNDTPRCTTRKAWTKQIDALIITDKDIISDSGIELDGLFKERGIDNLILMGVHTNMCIIHRPFGLRNMLRYGKHVVLARDLTDAMYDSRQYPFVNHFAGVGLMINYIEKYISPTILSTDLTGEAPFHFATDPDMLICR